MVSGGRVLVVCPGGWTSGGPEALHQLVNALVDVDIDASIVYVPASVTPERYAIYRAPVATLPNDAPENVVVVPETMTYILRHFPRSQHAIWWLSVDNYYVTRRHDLLRRPLLRHWTVRTKLDLHHLAQSAYARMHLIQRGVGPAAMLTDYLNRKYIERVESLRSRRDLVAYNPAKGLGFTREVIRRASHSLQWQALAGMSVEDVARTLRHAKLYVDFGHHPGRDRLPREAAVMGACVVTSRDGSAAHYEDVPIGEGFKIDIHAPGASDRAAELVRRIVADYESQYRAFDTYRQIITKQEEVFRREVAQTFVRT